MRVTIDLLLCLLLGSSVGCYRTSFTPDVASGRLVSCQINPSGTLVIKLKSQEDVKANAFLGCRVDVHPPHYELHFQLYKRGLIQRGHQLEQDSDNCFEYHLTRKDFDTFVSWASSRPAEEQPLDQILHVRINQDQVAEIDMIHGKIILQDRARVDLEEMMSKELPEESVGSLTNQGHLPVNSLPASD